LQQATQTCALGAHPLRLDRVPGDYFGGFIAFGLPNDNGIQEVVVPFWSDNRRMGAGAGEGGCCADESRLILAGKGIA
jgi:hypothetical protein